MKHRSLIKNNSVVICAVLFFLLFTITGRSQSVLNVETMRLSFDTADNWIGSVEVGGLYEAEVTDQTKIVIESSVHIGFKWNKNIVLFMGNFLFERVGEYDIENKYSVHLRYDYALSKKWYLEAFGQMQHNHQIELTRRDLLGAGIRFKALDEDKIKMNIGTLGMYEYQVISDTIFYNYIRSSSYLFIGVPVTKTFNILSTTYYQPLFVDFSNYRISSELAFDIAISKLFSFVLSYTIYYDSEIQQDVPSVNIPTDIIKLSLKIKF